MDETKFFDGLIDKRIIYLDGFIENSKVDYLSRIIVFLNSYSEAGITLYLNSGGGNIGAGFALYDVVKYSRAPITGIVLKRVSSMAILVLQGCKIRKALRHATFAFHNLTHQVDITCNTDRAEQFLEWVKEIRETQNVYNRLIGVRTSGGPELISQFCKQGKIVIAPEAREIGLIDEIIN